MTVWGVVFARGGSKGVPNKNLRTIAGIPLIGYSLQTAQTVPQIDRVLCSTDSRKIAEIASEYGAEIPFIRPSHLASDTSPEWESWKHLADFLVQHGAQKSDLLVSLPPTAPLRAAQDVSAAIDKFAQGNADVVVSYTQAHRNPWFNMVIRRDDGILQVVMKSSTVRVTRRQDAPVVYDLATVVYVTTLGFALSSGSMSEGKVTGIEIPGERAIDIDTELDLEIAGFLLAKREGSHE